MNLDTIGKRKMKVCKPPQKPKYSAEDYTIFLAGSIEMGEAEDWQSQVQERLKDKTNVVLFNPRRDDWDNSWKQSLEDENFHGQVKWEYDHLEQSDAIFFYFDPKTKSPVSMMELGLFADKKDVIVVCPDGFWRKGNIEFVCKMSNIPLFNTLDDGIEEMLRYIP